MFRLFRLTRTLLLILIVLFLAGTAACVVGAGRMLVDPRANDAPANADVIFVLSGGGAADRWLEGYDLWREKRAPLILLSRGFMDGASAELLRRGVRVPEGSEIARDILVGQLGMPSASVEILPIEVDNTAAEAEALKRTAAARGWHSAIVVTSLAHTRRTGLAMRRALEGTGMDIQIRASRYDQFEAMGWWRHRGSARWILSEWPKLVMYRLGLGE